MRRFLSSARLVLDVIASTGRRDMAPSELARRMRLRGHDLGETDKMVVLLLGRGLLTTDNTTLVMTDIGWGTATRRTPSKRVKTWPGTPFPSPTRAGLSQTTFSSLSPLAGRGSG